MGRSLGELELAIMTYIWKHCGSVTVPDVHRHLLGKRELAYTSTMTVMSRLYEKGLLGRNEEKRPYVYWAAVTQEDFSAQLMLGVLAEIGDREAVLTRFVERISKRDVRLLRDLLAKARGQRRR